MRQIIPAIEIEDGDFVCLNLLEIFFVKNLES